MTCARRLRAIVLVLGLMPAAVAAAAPRSPVAGRTPAQRERVVRLQQRVLALAAVEAVTVQSLASALGVQLAPPVQIHEYRREWPVLPSDVFADGTITEAGRDIIVSMKPAPALQLAFEDLAPTLSALPYFMESPSRHIDAHSLATRVYAIDHTFEGKGGVLRLQIPTTLPADTLDHDAKARDQGYASMYGTNPRIVLVETIHFTTDRGRLAPLSMRASLAVRRQRRMPARFR